MTSLPESSPTEYLRDIIYAGLFGDIFLAERARELHRAVAAHAADINAAGFGELFLAIQNAAIAELILSLTKLFERPSRQYRIRSIPAAVGALTESHGSLRPVEPVPALACFAKAGIDTSNLRDVSASKYTAFLAELLAASTPDVDPRRNDDLSRALRALRTSRDKRVAHSEAIDDGKLAQAKWIEAERLLVFAKHVTAGLAIAYFGSTAFSEDGEYYLAGADGHEGARQLRNLLIAASVVSAPSDDSACLAFEWRRQGAFGS